MADDDRTVQVPVSLIQDVLLALRENTPQSTRVARGMALHALLSQPTPTAEPVMLTYEGCKAYVLGTVVADADGYWSRLHRHYVKTSRNTWALFWKAPTAEEVAEAMREERNNISPCPSGYLAWVTEPAAEPSHIEDTAPGRRWAEGVYAINFQPGHYPSIVMPDVDGEDLLYEDGTWWNPSEGDTLTRLDPSTIRDVTPPAGDDRA